MFFPESENLLNEDPESSETIRKLDDYLAHRRPADNIDPRHAATFLSLPAGVVELGLQRFAEADVVRGESVVECPKCHSFFVPVDELDEAGESGVVCDRCETLLLSGIQPMEIYRMNARGPAASTAEGDVETTSTAKTPAALLGLAQMDLLRYYAQHERLVAEQPLAGKRALVILHFLRDLVPFVEACQHLGLDLRTAHFFFKPYRYLYRKEVAHWLTERGAQVAGLDELEATLDQLADSPSERLGEILVLEDGGYIVPALHDRHPQLLGATLGAVEQTTKGIREDEERVRTGLQIPVLSVARSRLKAEYEPRYIAEALVRNYQALRPEEALPGKRVAVLGFGTIGAEVADVLSGTAQVTIFDPDARRRLAAQEKGLTLADSIEQAVDGRHLVIGATGRQSITGLAIARLRHRAVLISASSDQVEFDVPEFRRQAIQRTDVDEGVVYRLPGEREVTLVADGYPINFFGFESMPAAASDLIMTLILLATVELAAGRVAGPGANPEEVNAIAERYEVATKHYEFSQQ